MVCFRERGNKWHRFSANTDFHLANIRWSTAMHTGVGESVVSAFELTCFVTLGLIRSGACPFNHPAFASTQATP